MRGGGVPVFTAHLVRSLRACGHNAILVRVMNGSRDLTPVQFTHGVVCNRWSMQTALAAVRGHKAILTSVVSSAGARADKRFDLERALPFIQARTPIVIHEVGQWLEKKTGLVPILDAAKHYGTPVITIRKTVGDLLRDRGLNATTILHPYIRANVPDTEKQFAAISATRVSHRKRTIWLAQANQLLPENKQIQIFGAADRPYFMVLDAKVPDWRACYRGPFPNTEDAAVSLLRQSHLAIDMTIIQGDGGGTQYAMLEAWDAGTPLVVHSSWLATGHVPALTADEPGQIAALVLDPPETVSIIREGLERLQEHSPQEVVPSILAVL